MATLLRFLPPFLATVLPQRTYWKLRWFDEWIPTPELWCNWAELNAGPGISTAQLEWRYGRGLSEGAAAFAARFREYNRLRHYVKVEFDTHELDAGGGGDTISWYGTLEIEQDRQDGALKRADVWYASGKTFFTAFGLEQQLGFTEVRSSRIRVPWGGEDWTAAGLTFNADEQPNKSAANGLDGVPIFEGRPTNIGQPSSLADHWSSRDIVQYLLQHHRPKDFNGQSWLPFVFADPDNVIPTWDRPELKSHGANVRDLLNSLICRQRLISYRLVVTDNEITLRPFSFTDEPISLAAPYGATMGYNSSQIRIAAERDTAGRPLIVKRSSLDAVDQVITEGAWRTSTASHCFLEDSLGEGWWGNLATERDEGGQSDPAFPPDGEVEDQILFVINFRARDKFKAVYCRFQLPDDWDGLVGDTGGGDRVPLMPVDGAPNSPAPLGLEHRKFCHALALKEHFDYSNPAQPQELIAGILHEHRKPFVVFPVILEPGEDRPADRDLWRWTTADNGSLSKALESVNFPVSVRTSVGRDGALYVEVVNGDQHWIAAEDFVPIDDVDEALEEDREVSFREMLATLTTEWSQRASGKYPSDDALPFGVDLVRRITIPMGDTFRCDYVLNGTVVDLNPDGTLVHAATEENGAYIQDDRDKLRGIAETAFRWYSRTRHAITLTTSLVTSAVQVGQYVTAVGDPALAGDIFTEDINSVVTSIRIESELIETDATGRAVAPPATKMIVTTDFGELDVLKMVK